MKKGFIDFGTLLFWTLILLLLYGLVASVRWNINRYKYAPCHEFINMPVEDIPARCVSEIMGER